MLATDIFVYFPLNRYGYMTERSFCEVWTSGRRWLEMENLRCPATMGASLIT